MTNNLKGLLRKIGFAESIIEAQFQPIQPLNEVYGEYLVKAVLLEDALYAIVRIVVKCYVDVYSKRLEEYYRPEIPGGAECDIEGPST
jgi:hypothetical protein